MIRIVAIIAFAIMMALILSACPSGSDVAGVTQGAEAEVRECSVAGISAIAPEDVKILSAVSMAPRHVGHCNIMGQVLVSDPERAINFRLALPDERFGGRYWFVTHGGGAGWLPQPNLNLLAAGFAIATTDTGHQALAPGDGWYDFAIDKVELADFAHRAAHWTTVAAQAITRSYYGTENLRRYSGGCSGQGRMAEQAAENYPNDYDGFIMVCPGLSLDPMRFVWTSQQVLRNDEAWVSPAKLAALEKEVKEACAGPDGLIRDVNTCGYDPADMQCTDGDGPDCLTVEQVRTIKAIVEGSPTVYPEYPGSGWPLNSPLGFAPALFGMTKPMFRDQGNPWAPHNPPPSFPLAHSMLRSLLQDDRTYDFMKDFDFDDPEDVAQIAKAYRENVAWTMADPKKLSAFKEAGGKIIYMMPIADPLIPAELNFRHWRGILEHIPGAEEFARFYAVPGVYHGVGGPGPKYENLMDRGFEEVIAWVEQGRSPEEIIVSATAGSTRHSMAPGGDFTATIDDSIGIPTPTANWPVAGTRTVLLCPWPKVAIFDAAPDDFPYDARNWRCGREP